MPLQRSPKNTNSSLKSFNSDPILNQTNLNAENTNTLLPGRRNTKRKIEDMSENSNSILTDLQTLFDKFEGRQNAKMEQLITSVNLVKSQNEELQNSIEFMSKKYDDFVAEMEDLRQENQNYRTRITNLENKLEVFERNHRANIIEVKNIPPQPLENMETLCNFVKCIGNEIGQRITDSEITEVYRQNTKQGNSHLIVHLKSFTLKDQIIRKYRQYNRESKINQKPKLNTSHINLATRPITHLPIYVDESLTGKTRRLRFLAKDFAAKNGYYGAWTAYGKVYLRKTERSPTIRIDDEKDFLKLSVI